jgi:hypothetical protein
MPRCDSQAMTLLLAENRHASRAGRPRRRAARSGRLASLPSPDRPTQHDARPAAREMPGTEPAAEHLAFMRDNWLSNRVFQSHDQIVDICCEAWNKLTDQPWRIMSIGMREWAYKS